MTLADGSTALQNGLRLPSPSRRRSAFRRASIATKQSRAIRPPASARVALASAQPRCAARQFPGFFVALQNDSRYIGATDFGFGSSEPPSRLCCVFERVAKRLRIFRWFRPRRRIVLRHMTKGSGLVLVGLIEMTTPLIRMIVLSHALSLTELGFVSALAVTVGAAEQISDFALYRYVFSASREEYEDSLAAAHGLAILRGLVIGALVALAAPLLGMIFNLQGNFYDFALLGPLMLIRGFDHLDPRVAERDYNYRPQLTAIIVSNVLSLAALFIAARLMPTHMAFLISLYVHAFFLVATDHIVASVKYRCTFFTPHFWKAFRFGYPLVFNGMGLAASQQGDRFLVGSFLGLPELAIYTVANLATFVPAGLIVRVLGPITLAQLYNAGNKADGSYDARLRLFARLIPLIAGLFALGVVSLLNIMLPLVFSAKFVLTPESTALLAASLFFRQVRSDPFVAMLLNSGRTKRLAIANLSASSALLFMFLLLFAYRSFEAVMLGRLLGEITGWIVTLILTRDLFKPARADFFKSVAVGLAVFGAAVALAPAGVGVDLLPSLGMVMAGLLVFSLWALTFVPRLLDASYPAIRQQA
jgi:O-antigen/teichoic acid export membrane protein